MAVVGWIAVGLFAAGVLVYLGLVLLDRMADPRGGDR